MFPSWEREQENCANAAILMQMREFLGVTFEVRD